MKRFKQFPYKIETHPEKAHLTHIADMKTTKITFQNIVLSFQMMVILLTLTQLQFGFIVSPVLGIHNFTASQKTPLLYHNLSRISERQHWNETSGNDMTSRKLSVDSAHNVKSCVRQHVTSYMDLRYVQNLAVSLPLLSKVSGDTFRLGYCLPFFHCPVTVPLAYREIPKNGCSTWKRYLHELDGLNWTLQHKTQHVCCKEGNNRVKVLITRNPYTRFVSMFVNKVLKDEAVTTNRSVILQRFGQFVDKIIHSTDIDEKTDHHFRSQYVHDTTSQNKGKQSTRDCQGLHMVLKLEELDDFGFSLIEKRLCSELGYCRELPSIRHSKGGVRANESPLRGGFLTAKYLFGQNPAWGLLIAKRYKTDFSLYGYSTSLDEV